MKTWKPYIHLTYHSASDQYEIHFTVTLGQGDIIDSIQYPIKLTGSDQVTIKYKKTNGNKTLIVTDSKILPKPNSDLSQKCDYRIKVLVEENQGPGGGDGNSTAHYGDADD